MTNFNEIWDHPLPGDERKAAKPFRDAPYRVAYATNRNAFARHFSALGISSPILVKTPAEGRRRNNKALLSIGRQNY